MLFNSNVFVLFFIVVYAFYVLARKSSRTQNRMLLVASYVFYGWWDWRFLSLLAFSTIVDYFVGQALPRTRGLHRRRVLLLASLTTNLGLLGFFKYFDFFAGSFTRLLGTFGLGVTDFELEIILPVGISFYTFQTLSYTIEIYRGRLSPTRSLPDFALYVSFFPQLVAGPIERAANLLPQIARPRRLNLDQIQAGLFLIMWGYFKKCVVADNLARTANEVFGNYPQYQGLEIVAGILAFTFQIYGDFSGYSDIARGLSKLLGFELMVNFKLPYFALNPTDFWLRWHVSLSSWLRDYLYIPLGGNRGSSLRTSCNLGLTMLLGGLWHGAAWTFVFWGAFHGSILILYRFLEKTPIHADPWNGSTPRAAVIARMALMFVLTMIGWVIFRSESVTQMVGVLSRVGPQVTLPGLKLMFNVSCAVIPFMIIEILQYRSRNLSVYLTWPAPVRLLFATAILASIFLYGVRESVEFIYFQF